MFSIVRRDPPRLQHSTLRANEFTEDEARSRELAIDFIPQLPRIVGGDGSPLGFLLENQCTGCSESRDIILSSCSLSRDRYVEDFAFPKEAFISSGFQGMSIMILNPVVRARFVRSVKSNQLALLSWLCYHGSVIRRSIRCRCFCFAKSRS